MDTLGRAAELLAATPFPEGSVKDERLAGILLDLLEIDGHFYGLAQIALGGQRIDGGRMSVDLEGTRGALLSLVDLNPGDRRARGLDVQLVDACIGIREALSERRGDQSSSVHEGAGVEAEDDGEES